MGISLKHLEQKKLEVGMNKLREAGIDVEQWLAMLNADSKTMQRLVAAWPGSPTVMPQLPIRPGIIYSDAEVGRALGLPANCDDPLPPASDGEIVIYYGGWTLSEIEFSRGGSKRMVRHHDRNHYTMEYYQPLFEAKAGYYKLLLPVPGSDCMTWGRQLQHLAICNPKAKPAPALVVVTALLVHALETYEDLLNGGRCRCKEVEGLRIKVGCDCGHVYVYSYAGTIRNRVIVDDDNQSSNGLYLAAVSES